MGAIGGSPTRQPSRGAVLPNLPTVEIEFGNQLAPVTLSGSVDVRFLSDFDQVPRPLLGLSRSARLTPALEIGLHRNPRRLGDQRLVIQRRCRVLSADDLVSRL